MLMWFFFFSLISSLTRCYYSWERQCFSFSLLVLFIIGSFCSCKSERGTFFSVLFTVLCCCYYYRRCRRHRSSVHFIEWIGWRCGECVCVHYFFVLSKIERTLTTKLVASQPQKWHAIAIRMNDLSFQLDLMYAVCSIVRFSIFFSSLLLALLTHSILARIFDISLYWSSQYKNKNNRNSYHCKKNLIFVQFLPGLFFLLFHWEGTAELYFVSAL